MDLGIIDKCEMMDEEDLKFFDGIFGLSTNPELKGSESSIMQYFKANYILRQIISYKVNKNERNKYTAKLILGGIDPKYYYRDIKWIAGVSNNVDPFVVKCKSIKAGHYSDSPSKEYEVGFDTGSNVIQVPERLFNYLSSLVKSPEYKILSFDKIIAKLPDLEIFIGNEKYSVSAEDYLHKSDVGVGKFRLAPITLSSGSVDILLGNPFFIKHHLIYDYKKKRVGVISDI